MFNWPKVLSDEQLPFSSLWMSPTRNSERQSLCMKNLTWSCTLEICSGHSWVLLLSLNVRRHSGQKRLVMPPPGITCLASLLGREPEFWDLRQESEPIFCLSVALSNSVGARSNLS